METDQSASEDETSFDIINDVYKNSGVLDVGSMTYEFLVELIDLVLSGSSERAISCFAYALLKESGITPSQIKAPFLT